VREILKVENMKGDIAFVGFVLTAEEWRELDAESRAALCAVATRTHDGWSPQRLARSSDAPPVSEPGTLAEGSGPLEVVETEYIDLDLND
jgi:hypothetical protein